MDPCWHPKSMKTRKRRVPEGVQKALHFGTRFHMIWVPSWPSTWPRVGAPDDPRRRLRAPKRRPRRPPTRSRSRPERAFLDFGEFFGNRSPRTPQTDSRNSQNQLKIGDKISKRKKTSDESVVEIFPFLEDSELVLQTACLRPLSADKSPIISKSDVYKNLFLASGTGRQGILLAPAMGKLISDMTTNNKTEIEVSDFSHQRFKN